MNGEYLRGEVYWVCLDDSVGGEEKTGRPAVIVSANGVNAKLSTVTVAFASTSGFASPTRPSIERPDGLKRRVLCDQLRTIDKSRLSRYDSTLSESELIRVTGALASTLSIPLPKNEKKPVTAVEEKPDEIVSLKCEADMWRRMYESVMGQLVEIRVAADMGKVKKGIVEPDPGFEEESAPEPEKKPEPKKKKTPAKKSKEKNTAWDGIKVNVNTVPTGAELKRKTGMSRKTADEIIRTRKVLGKYEKIEDLLALDTFGDTSMKRYGHMLEV